MSDDFSAVLQGPSHYEPVFVGSKGTTVRCFGYQPNTDDIAANRYVGDRFCVQLIGRSYEVYDLETLTQVSRAYGVRTIGLPVFAHEDADAAIMWALMNL